MVGSKRSTRIAARKSRQVMNNVQDGDEKIETGSTKCDDDGEPALSPLDSSSDYLYSLSAESVESHKRRGKSQQPCSSRLSDKTQSSPIQPKEYSAMTQITSFAENVEIQAPREKLFGARKRMISEAHYLSGGSKRSKLSASDDCTSDLIAKSSMLLDGIHIKTPGSLSNILSESLGLKDDTAASRKLDVDNEVREMMSPQPQRDDSQHCEKDIKNGATQALQAENTEMETHPLKNNTSILFSSSERIKGESPDEGNHRALNQTDVETLTQAPNNASFPTCNDNVEEHSKHADEIPEPVKERAEVSRSSIKRCELNETKQYATSHSTLLSANKDERNITENDVTEHVTPKDDVFSKLGDSQTNMNIELPCLGEVHGRVERNDSGEDLTGNNSLIPSQLSRKSPSVSQLKMALFLEATKAHCSRNDAVLSFAKYWDTLGKYLSLGTHDALEKVRPDIRSRAGIESILSEFLKTRKMKLLHNKLILSIMAEAMKTHVPAHYSTHAPRQWKNKLTRSLSATIDEVKNDCCNRATTLPHWNANFGPESGTWTASGGDITLSKTDCSCSIEPEFIGSIRRGVLAEEGIFPSCRLPGALDIDPLVRRLTSHSGIKVSENAVWMIIVAVREYSSSIFKKIIANDKYFECGYAPWLPKQFHTSLACHHNSLTTIDLLEGGEQVQDERKPKEGSKHDGKRVITSTCLSNILAENLSAASRLTSMYVSASLNDRRGTSSLAGLDAVKCLVNASIQKAASRRYKSSPEFEDESSTPATVTKNNLDGTTPIHAYTRPSIQLHDTHTQVVPPSSTAQSFPASSLNSLLHRNQPQLIPLPINPQYPMGHPSMPFQRVQSINHCDPMMNPLGRRNSENQPPLRSVLPILRPNREHPLKTEVPPPELITNVKKTPDLSSLTATPKNTPSFRRESKNSAAMMTRNDNDEGESTMEEEEKVDGKDNATPPVSSTSPTNPQSRVYGVKNIAAIKTRASSASSTETGK